MKEIFLYFSAFIPMYFLILIKFVIEKINNNIRFNVLNTIIFVLLTILIILGIIGLLWNIKWNNDKSEEVYIVSAHNITDQHFFGYISLFVLFALSFELTKVAMFVLCAIIITLIGVVYVNNKMFYINPLLNILGFNFYEVTFYLKNDPNKTQKKIKMFYHGILNISNHPYKVKIKNKNFAFIDKK